MCLLLRISRSLFHYWNDLFASRIVYLKYQYICIALLIDPKSSFLGTVLFYRKKMWYTHWLWNCAIRAKLKKREVVGMRSSLRRRVLTREFAVVRVRIAMKDFLTTLIKVCCSFERWQAPYRGFTLSFDLVQSWLFPAFTTAVDALRAEGLLVCSIGSPWIAVTVSLVYASCSPNLLNFGALLRRWDNLKQCWKQW